MSRYLRWTVPLILVVAAAQTLPAAETTRTLRLELRGDPARAFRVENLAGSMRVRAGAGDTVVAVATIHAESSELADLMRFEQVSGEKGVPTLRLRYPIDRYKHYRYGTRQDSGFVSWLFGASSNIKYDGTHVRVSGNGGVGLFADVEVELPRKFVDGHFRNAVGPIEGNDVQGRVTFDSGSGNVTLSHVSGTVVADTGSGDVKASDIEGSFVCDTGSGQCTVAGFKGENMKCDTGSGTVSVRAAVARRISIDTGSGDVRVREADAEEFSADTGSGSVELENRGTRLTRIKADTGSGDVRLRLAPDAMFEAHANTGSGDVRSHYTDAQAIVHGKEVVGWRRGDGRIRIDVDTGSGDFVVEPTR